MRGVAYREAFDTSPPLFESKLGSLHRVWEEKKQGGNLPQWTDFSPRDLKSWLHNIAIIDRVGEPPRYKVRLMGMGCTRIGGKDYTGRYIDECVEHRCREELQASYALCLTSGRPLFRRVDYVKEKMVRTSVHRLFLPCLDGDGAATIVLVAAYDVEEFGYFYDLPTELAKKAVVEDDTAVFLL